MPRSCWTLILCENLLPFFLFPLLWFAFELTLLGQSCTEHSALHMYVGMYIQGVTPGCQGNDPTLLDCDGST